MRRDQLAAIADDVANDVMTVIDGAIVPLLARLAAADARIADLERRLDESTGGLTAVRDRLADVELRAAQPGPAGPAGVPGPAGADGLDGFGFDDLQLDYDGQRTITVRFSRADRVAVFPLSVPWPLYQGTYVAGQDYARGDVVTSGGSAWHAHASTRERPGEHPSWQLMVQRGKHGRNADRDVPPKGGR